MITPSKFKNENNSSLDSTYNNDVINQTESKIKFNIL